MNRSLAGLLVALALVASSAHASGTINLPAQPYCATAQDGAAYNGVTVGVCAPVNVPPQGSCPAGRQATASVCYSYTTRGSTCRVGADVTSFDQVFGRTSSQAPAVGFPGVQYYAVIANMPGPGYIALKFHTPAVWPAKQVGILTHGETLPGPNITAVVSDKCGDFTPANAQCGPVTGGPGQLVAKWRADSYTASNGCPLLPNHDYYENVRVTDPAMCGPACIVTLQNNHTP